MFDCFLAHFMVAKRCWRSFVIGFMGFLLTVIALIIASNISFKLSSDNTCIFILDTVHGLFKLKGALSKTQQNITWLESFMFLNLKTMLEKKEVGYCLASLYGLLLFISMPV